MKLTDAHADEPQTYEDWMAIHGEPEYITTGEKPLSPTINVANGMAAKEAVDYSNLIWEDKYGKKHLNYSDYAHAFIAINECVFCHGQFYTPKGTRSVGLVRQDIAESLADSGWTDKNDSVTNSILATIRDFSYQDDFPIDSMKIPFSNGDMYISTSGKWEFRRNEQSFTPYRLNVRYVENDRPMPLFNKWLHDVFEGEDIVTVQEMLGYALVPTTAAQEAFFLVGPGKVGKSVIGTLLSGIFGSAFCTAETKEITGSNRFMLATAENKLVVYDDDLGEAALSDTGIFKKLITADSPIKAERKYQNPYSYIPFCTVIACANFMLSSLYDDSDAFFRRLHPIKVKNPDPHRRNIAKFGELILAEEKEQIVKWALQGLWRVMCNDWHITWSERSKQYMDATKTNAVHFPEFIENTLTVGEGDISSKELQRLYKKWCDENNIPDAKIRRMQSWFTENAEKYGIKAENNLYRNGKHVRGWKNASVKEEWRDCIII